MTTTIRFLGGFILVCCLLAALSPSRAEEPPLRGGAWVTKPAPPALRGESADETVERLMQARIDVVCEGRLDEALSAIGRALGAPLAIDTESLDDMGIGMDSPVDWDCRGCTAWEAFNHVLEELDLEAVVAGGRIVVLTKESAEVRVASEVLDVDVLLRAAEAQADQARFLENLCEVFTTTVQPSTWEDVGGSGRLNRSARARDGRLLLSASYGARRKVKTLLAALNEAAKAKTCVSAYPFLDENASALAALEKQVTFDVQDLPIPDAAAEIGRQIGMPINLDRRAMEDMGIGLDTPLRCRCRNLRAADALMRMLRDHELACTCRGGSLLITTREHAECCLNTAVFDIHDIVNRGDDWRDLDSFIQIVTCTVDPCTWDFVGGPGSIAPVCLKDHTLVVVSQTHENLLEIKSLLEGIRRIKRAPWPFLRAREADRAAVDKALAKRVRWHFDNTPLDEAAVAMAAGLGVDVFVDRVALDDMGIDHRTPVSLPDGRYAAADAIRRVLRPKELTYLAVPGGLIITTTETAESRLETIICDVNDLMERPWNFVAVINCVTTVIQPTTWDEVGGAGAIEPFLTNERALIVVSQTQEVLEETTRLFTGLREIRKSKAKVLLLESETDTAVRKALERQVAWPFHETPLPEALARIAAELGIHVYLDARAFDEAGIDAATVRLSSAFSYTDAFDSLQRILRAKKLCFCIKNGGIMVHPASERWYLKEALFNVTDLIESGKATPGGLVEAICETVEPELWAPAGGAGSIAVIEIPDGRTILAASQEYYVLREVERRLERLRRR